MATRTIAMAREKAQEMIERDPNLDLFPDLKQLVGRQGLFLKA
jgi:hypothetical protein